MEKPYLSYSAKGPGASSLVMKRVSLKNAELRRQMTIEEQREAMRVIADKLVQPKKCGSQPVFCADVPCEWVWSLEREPVRGTIVYLHGGGWIYGNIRYAKPFAALLAESVGCRVLAVDYRLAPEHPYPCALDDAEVVYRRLLDSGYNGGKIALAGDSAGGNLALCLVHRLKNAGLPLPAGLALASPVTDARETSALARSRADLLYAIHRGVPTDIFSLYLGGNSREEPCVSPVCGELSGFPPLLIHTGGDEPLAADNELFAQKAFLSGVDAHLKLWDEMFHDFTIAAPVLPEGRESVRELAAFLRARLGLESLEDE